MAKKVPVKKETRSDPTEGGNFRESRPADDFFTDAVHLADHQQGDLLRYLSDRSPATLTDAAEQLAAREFHAETEAITASQRKCVQKRLLRTHIPHLQTYGFIEYEKSSETVTLTAVGETVVNA